jgi:hypothetical protein
MLGRPTTLSTLAILSSLGAAGPRAFSSLIPFARLPLISKSRPPISEPPIYWPIPIHTNHNQNKYSTFHYALGGLAAFGLLAVTFRRKQKQNDLQSAYDELTLSPAHERGFKKVLVAHGFNYLAENKTSREIARAWLLARLSKLEDELDENGLNKQQYYQNLSFYQKLLLLSAFREFDPEKFKGPLTEALYLEGLSQMKDILLEKHPELYRNKLRVSHLK